MGSFDNFGRRRSFSGSGFAPSNGFPPHTEAVFRPGRDGGFNDFGHPESYSSGPGSYPPSAGMGSSYPMGTPYSNSYEGSPLSDNPFPPPLDDGGFTRGRSLSAGGGFGPPALMPPPGPMTPYPSNYGHPKRARRASSVGPGMGMGYGVGGYTPDMYHRPGGRVTVKFRLKGEPHSGISVAEALNRERLSQSHGYMMHDIAPDMLGRITLKVRWSGYHSNTYEIPLSNDFQGYVNLASLARRTGRAIVHFMQANGIILSWDRVVMHRLEEIRPGIWIPVLTTH